MSLRQNPPFCCWSLSAPQLERRSWLWSLWSWWSDADTKGKPKLLRCSFRKKRERSFLLRETFRCLVDGLRWRMLWAFSQQLLLKLFKMLDQFFLKITFPDTLLFDKSSKYATFFFLYPRDEINSLSRPGSFRRLNSVSTDPRMQVWTQSSAPDNKNQRVWEIRGRHARPARAGPAAAPSAAEADDYRQLQR